MTLTTLSWLSVTWREFCLLHLTYGVTKLRLSQRVARNLPHLHRYCCGVALRILFSPWLPVFFDVATNDSISVQLNILILNSTKKLFKNELLVYLRSLYTETTILTKMLYLISLNLLKYVTKCECCLANCSTMSSIRFRISRSFVRTFCHFLPWPCILQQSTF